MADDQQTLQLRDFKGANLTDTRTSIDDTEFAFLENAIPIGKGNLKLVPGSTVLLANVTSSTIVTMWGFNMTTRGNTSAVLLTVNADGSMNQVEVSESGGVNTNTIIAPINTVTTDCRLTIWKDNPVLIEDPKKGYFEWAGSTTVQVIDANKTGRDVAVFEGRAWLLTGSRTYTFSEPNHYADFTAAGGAGTATLTDSAFPGKVTRLLSALEQLWVVGGGAVDAISNVQTAGGVTTFSTTNIVSSVGSTFPSSVSSFFRTFLFLTPYGIYAIVGATPQKLSDKLDGLFPALNLGTDAPSAVGTVHNVFVWCVLVTYNDPAVGLRPILLCFTQGKWFIASAGTITWLTSLIVNGIPEIFATDGKIVFRMFGSNSAAVTYLIKSKLFDFGDSTQMKEWIRFGLELQSDNVVTPLVTIENEIPALSANLNLTAANTIVFTGLGGVPIVFVGAGPITWVTTGLQLVRNAEGIEQFGQYLGYSIQGSEAVWTLSATAMEVKPGGKWNNLRAS